MDENLSLQKPQMRIEIGKGSWSVEMGIVREKAWIHSIIQI